MWELFGVVKMQMIKVGCGCWLSLKDSKTCRGQRRDDVEKHDFPLLLELVLSFVFV